ncbi:endonuclease III [Helicobacter mustelae]|nr:3-methyladenine DNA glycosylase [Helicobacter mustelae]SQH71355.1 endonuclease III [Helicobacter mustelae]STP12482.1 endonuclease III [Helicobacter mustelae]
MFQSSYELFIALEKMNLLEDLPPYWWPNAHSFEVVVGAILTQNTKWENVERVLENLKRANILLDDNEKSLKNFASSDALLIASHIIPSGFFRQKSVRLVMLAGKILEFFGSFGNFCENVDREWLLEQKGIGKESADSILNYACNRPVMVVDRYTQRLVSAQGYEFEDYDCLQEWLQDGIESHFSKMQKYQDLSQIYSQFHGMIVEFSKRKLELR